MLTIVGNNAGSDVIPLLYKEQEVKMADYWPSSFRRGSRILKWGVNFLHLNQRFRSRDKKKKRKKGAQKKGGENSPISPPLDPRLFFCGSFLTPVFVTMQKKNEGSNHLMKKTWPIMNLFYAKRTLLSRRTWWVISTGKDRTILPAWRADHSAWLGSSCLLTKLTTYIIKG